MKSTATLVLLFSALIFWPIGTAACTMSAPPVLPDGTVASEARYKEIGWFHLGRSGVAEYQHPEVTTEYLVIFKNLLDGDTCGETTVYVKKDILPLLIAGIVGGVVLVLLLCRLKKIRKNVKL